MEKYQVIVGWGYNTEQLVGDEMSLNEARKLYIKLHAEWVDVWFDDEIESEEAQEDRPSLCVVREDGTVESYY